MWALGRPVAAPADDGAPAAGTGPVRDAGRFVVVHSDAQSCVIALQGMIALQGTITHDTALKFDKVVEKTKQLGCDAPWLLLESPGGDLLESLALGKDVHFSHFRTVTRYECASGCALIFWEIPSRTIG